MKYLCCFFASFSLLRSTESIPSPFLESSSLPESVLERSEFKRPFEKEELSISPSEDITPIPDKENAPDSFYELVLTKELPTLFRSHEFLYGFTRGFFSGEAMSSYEFITHLGKKVSISLIQSMIPCLFFYQIEALFHRFQELDNSQELLDTLYPELVECKYLWNHWSDYVKGLKLGAIFGKYGIQGLYPL